MDNSVSSNGQQIADNPKMAHYHRRKDNMHTGDLLLWQEEHVWWKWIYRKFIGSKGDHVSLIIRLQQYEGDEKDHRRYTLEARRKQGTALNLLSRRLDGYVGKVTLYRLKSDWTPDERKKIGKVILEEVGKAYDSKSMIKTFIVDILRRFRKNIRLKYTVDDSKLFCSEYCYLAYKTARNDLCISEDYGKGTITIEGPPQPKDLFDLEIFDKGEQIYPPKESK